MNLNREEIERLWGQVTPKLYGYLSHTLRDAALADDILQATWLKALESLHTFQDRGLGFSPWIFSIARNEMRMHWRTSGRQVAYEPEIHDIPKDDKNYEDVILVEQVLKYLSLEDQELLRLRFIADLSMAEMSKVLKMNPVATRVKMHRTMNRVRLILNKKYE
jgi:RNA polymerase sigma-70 factor (ECF subfamily)